MKSGCLQAICGVALLFAVPLNGRAQNLAVPPEVKAYAAQYVAAFNAGDMEALESLNLPQSRACITPANKEIYDSLLSMQMRDSVPPGYRLTLMPVNEGNLKALASHAYFPVKPERELHIDYEYAGTEDGGSLVLWLVRQNGRWTGDFPCMTEEAIRDFRDSAADREYYRAIAAAIKEPLRSELTSMVRVHKLGEAEARYQKVTGGDMRTAVLVITALQEQVR